MVKLQVICSIPVEKWYTYEIDIGDDDENDCFDALLEVWDKNETMEFREAIIAKYKLEFIGMEIHDSIRSEENRTYSKLLLYPDTVEEYNNMVESFKSYNCIHVYYPLLSNECNDIELGMCDGHERK